MDEVYFLQAVTNKEDDILSRSSVETVCFFLKKKLKLKF